MNISTLLIGKWVVFDHCLFWLVIKVENRTNVNHLNYVSVSDRSVLDFFHYFPINSQSPYLFECVVVVDFFSQNNILIPRPLNRREVVDKSHTSIRRRMCSDGPVWFLIRNSRIKPVTRLVSTFDISTFRVFPSDGPMGLLQWTVMTEPPRLSWVLEQES